MLRHFVPNLVLTCALVLLSAPPPLPACCPAPRTGQPVVNADQTVAIIWDAAAKTQHFIRRASFKSEADDFGFLIPSPTQPELHESSNDAFKTLAKLTEPETVKQQRPSGGVSCGCGSKSARMAAPEAQVKVLDEKIVAGFKAAVLEATSAEALVAWLKDNGYAFSPEVQAWAKPYIEQGWKITALKVAKGADGKLSKDLTAKALRMSFKTERPLFPYREPDSKSAAEALKTDRRLLRIYFLADARYQGELTKEVAWTGRAVWAGKLAADSRKELLQALALPENTGPAEWFLTEFEDPWPYQLAPADVYFARSGDQTSFKRPPIIVYVSSLWPHDATVYAMLGVMVAPWLLRRLRRRAVAP